MFVPMSIAAVAAAMALPNSLMLPLKQANPAITREQAAIRVIQSLNRAQQASYVEYGRFAFDLSSTRTGLPERSEGYAYHVMGTDFMSVQSAAPLAANLRSIVGAVMPDAQRNPVAIICRALTAGSPARPPIAQNGRLTCAAGTELLP